MRNDASRPTSVFSDFESLLGKSKSGVVILVALALAVVSPQFAFGQTTQQQQQEEQQREEQQREEQQREEQQREEQQREEQAREQQQREEQAREQQQREEQAREDQQRQQQQEEQQREEQEREQQAREEQQREQQEQQQREQQAREQQVREQQQQDDQRRAEQERQRQQTTGTPPSPSEHSQVTGTISSGRQVLEPDGRINAPASQGEKKVPTSQDSRQPASDLPHRPCDKEPCTEPGPKPVPPDLRAKLCKDGPCPVCAPGQSPGKDNSCVSPLEKTANTPPKPSAVPQSCPAGQIWNGVQCSGVGPEQCLPGQAKVGSFCQADCTSAVAGAQNFIELLRMARQDKDHACTQNPTGDECSREETTYDMRLNEYRNYLGGVPSGCTLPDPISI